MQLLEIKNRGIETTPQKLLVYGEPKCGKTEAVGRLCGAKKENGEPLFKKIYWFDLEKGYTTLLKLEDEILEKITLISILDTSKQPNAVVTIMKVFEAKNTICDKHGILKSKCLACRKDPAAEYYEIDLFNEDTSTLVVLDSVSQLSNSALNNATNNTKVPVDLASLDSESKASFNHYGMQGRYLSKIISDWQQLPCHGVMISHEKNLKNEEEKEKLTAVAGTSNFSREFPKAFDHVIRLYVKNKKHMGISNTTDNAAANAGSRLNAAIYKDGVVDLSACFRLNKEEESSSPNTEDLTKTSMKKPVSLLMKKNASVDKKS